ncbi:GNAT family N-acetyltransferase [Streptomyces chartreusis]|uniref:GNAT family N-acetyltransferase n=1 Tax=Streptomyces chartreusis TaxID=1969 RepID=UPI003F4E44EC
MPGATAPGPPFGPERASSSNAGRAEMHLPGGQIVPQRGAGNCATGHDGAADGRRPVAVHLAERDGALHIEQVSVHPDAARRGVGRALLAYAADRARKEGLAGLTLTTFTEVPWNPPYYARLGFRTLEEAELTPGLRKIRAHEAELGLDRRPRVCMRRD